MITQAGQLLNPDQDEVSAAYSPTSWEERIRTLFPSYVGEFADRHVEFWEWVNGLRKHVAPRPFIGIWPRGGGKSTSAELAVCDLGLRGVRKYCLYVRATQENADKSVANIATLLEKDSVSRTYPAHAERLLSKYGSSKGWRRNRLRTSGGFTVDAIGLDAAARGAKVDEHRPDLIILDDIDEKHDSAKLTKKKLEIIKNGILPAGTSDVAVVAIQNLIIPNGIFSQLADGRADFLIRRVVSGPHPAVLDLKTERVPDEETGGMKYVIAGGTASWEGQSLHQCQSLIDLIGLSAFNEECQHEVQVREGALWTRDLLAETRTQSAPALKRIVIGVDPPGGRTECGIVVAGLGFDGHGYVLTDYSLKGKPEVWAGRVARAYRDHEADKIIAEKNFGGDMVESTIKAIDSKLPVSVVTASRGKAVRAEPVSTLYNEGRVHHVGVHTELEAEMTSWVPGDPESPNRMDALVWAITELMLQHEEPAEPWVAVG